MAIPGMSGAAPMDPMDPKMVQSTEANGVQNSNPLPFVTENEPAEEETQTPPQKKAQAKLQDFIDKNKGVIYNEVNISVLAQIFSKQKLGDEIIIPKSAFPAGTTLGGIKLMFNLPDGSLRHLADGGGNLNNAKIDELTASAIVISAKDLREALGISSNDLKQMFPDDQFENWKFGQGK